MATLHPAVAAILDSLAGTPLAGLAAAARDEINIMPPDVGDDASRASRAPERQLAAIERSVLFPLKVELESLEMLPKLATELGLSARIEVAIEPGERGWRTVQLGGEAQVSAVATIVDVLGRMLGQARDSGGELA